MAGFYLAVPGALSVAQCDAAIALAEGRLAPAPVYDARGPSVNVMVRDVGTVLIERAEVARLFEVLDSLFARGAEAFGLAVEPLSEPIQILRYETGGHFQMWHSDAGGDLVGKRRISMSVELSPLADHQGGVLEVVPDPVGQPRILEQGGAHLFPSQALHRVTPVTSGTRWALVAWTG
jgi:PKHD-type hydroxylase